MEIALGIVLILSFFALVYYCVKGHNLMVGFFVMTCIWALIALIGNCIVPNDAITGKYGALGGSVTLWTQSLGVLTNIFQEGPQGYGSSILVNIFFGAFFGRILVETNIASTLIRKVVELGGDKPRVILTLLCVVTALLFTSMTGIGPVISIAVIIVPILLTLGVSAPVTLFAFMGSIMAGIFANITNFAQYIGIFGASQDVFSYQNYAWLGWTGLVVTLVVVLVVANLVMSFSKTSHAWAAKAPNKAPKIKMKNGKPVIVEPVERMSKIENAPWYSWISIVLPVLLVITLKFPIILAFIVSGLYALVTCRKLDGGFKGICRKLAKLFGDGAIDVAPMIGFLLCLAMFNNSATFVAPYFRAVLGDIIPKAGLALAIVFAVFAPLGFFRGPLNLVGCGAAILAVLKSTNPQFFDVNTILAGDPALAISTITFGFGLFAITTVAPQHLDVTQSWVAWGFGYTKVSTKDYMKMSIPTGWIVCIIMIAILYFVSLGNGIF